MASGPTVAEVAQLLLPWILIPAPAMLVIGSNGGVVVAGNSRYSGIPDELYRLIRPGRISDQIAQVISSGNVMVLFDAGEHCLQRREVGMNVRDQGISLQFRAFRITTAEAGHAPWNSMEHLTPSLTSSGPTQANPN